jgi:predicted Zn-ribbon and HTH transcriptional regulator
MKTQEKIPEERNVTIRQEILKLLACDDLTIGELSKIIGKSEKELYDHLEHLLVSRSLVIIPAECLKCGYLFEKREKVKKPGKCPQCKGTHIKQPVFSSTKT